VGWSYTNGVLTQVTVTLNDEEVHNAPVSGLRSAAKEAVENVFDSKPGVILIQIACSP